MNIAPAALQDLLRRLEKLERVSADELAALQQQQLNRLIEYSAIHSPQFSQRLRQAGLDARAGLPLDSLSLLTPLTRRDIQSAGASLYFPPFPPPTSRLRRRVPPVPAASRWWCAVPH